MKKSKRNRVASARRRPDFAHLFRTKARDGAGWTSAYAESSTLVDSTNPVVTLVEISEGSAYAHVTGSTLYYGVGNGSFTLQVTALDATSGLDWVIFPSTTSSGATVQYDGEINETVAHVYELAGGGSFYDATISARDRALRTGGVSFNVIHDGVAPIISLQANATGASISVNWSNTTDAGAGVASYDLDVRVDDELTWTSLLVNSQATSYIHTADPGHRYTFRLTATDNVGNAASAEAEATARHITKYYYFGSQRVAKRGPDGAVTWLHGDHLGSTSLATNDVGAALLGSETWYYPFGEVRAGGGLPTDFGYTGQRLDGTGLMFYNARYYAPTIGRFIQADTIVPELENPQAWNRYSYAYNNPLRYVDPSGHNGWDKIKEWIQKTFSKILKRAEQQPRPTPTVHAEEALLLLSGSWGDPDSIDKPGPDPEVQLPVFSEMATETVQYPGSKQGQADNVRGNYANLRIVGYSAGADAALIYAHDQMEAGRLGIADIALLGPTMTGAMRGGGGLSTEWTGILDDLLIAGVDVYILDDSTTLEPAQHYGPPAGASGTYYYDERENQVHYGYTNSSPEYAAEVVDWFDKH